MSLKITIEEQEDEEEKLPSAKDLALKRKAMKMMAKMHGKKKPGKTEMPENDEEEDD